MDPGGAKMTLVAKGKYEMLLTHLRRTVKTNCTIPLTNCGNVHISALDRIHSWSAQGGDALNEPGRPVAASPSGVSVSFYETGVYWKSKGWPSGFICKMVKLPFRPLGCSADGEGYH